MPAPIPSFFKIRCGLIIILCLLFLMFLGMLKRAFADVLYQNPTANGMFVDNCVSFPDCCGDCGADYFCKSKGHSGFISFSNGTGGPAYRIKGGNICDVNYCVVFAGVTCAGESCVAQKEAKSSQCGGPNNVICDSACNCSCSDKCTDVNNDGIPDACQPCPSQTGYKFVIQGVFAFCGQNLKRCDGTSETFYEYGFGPNTCTASDEPPCHLTEDCQRDNNQDGVADGQEGGGGYDASHPHADLDGDGIPDMKDCDFDYDNDGVKNCEDPCANNSDQTCTDPCAGITDGTCKDTDGDGMADSQDPCPQNADRSCTDSGQSDSDHDGKLDKDDPCPRNSDTGCVNPCAGDTSGSCKDTDGDGLDDANDPCANNSNTSCTNPCSGDTSGTCKDTDGDGTKDADDKCPDNPDTSCTGDGTGSGDGTDSTTKPYTIKEKPYEYDTKAFESYKERFSQFLTNIRSSSIGSIVDRARGGLHSVSGGESSVPLNFGQYGEQNFDFSAWSQGLAALSAIYLALCSGIAIRIIILKR